MAEHEEVIKTQVRLPAELHEQIKVSSDRNFRSFNSEILYLLQVGLRNAQPHATPEQVREIVMDVVRSEWKRNREG